MSEPNVFLALGKYSTSEENYLTEAFVFLLNTLLLRERAAGVEILNNLCVANREFCFDVTENISVSTQEATEQGTPDIKISSPDKLVYVEVKYESDVGVNQVERYLEALKSSNVPNTCLVLLTKLALDFDDNESKTHKHVRWREVHDWLSVAQVREPINQYLVDDFKSFLKEKGMSIQKVGWEYIGGIPAFNNLIDMVEKAIRDVGIPFSKSAPKGFGWDYKGYSMEGGFWCGIVYDDHLYLIFEIWDKQKYDTTQVKQPTYPIRDNNKSIFFDLIFEKVHFFSLDKDKQLEEITKFIKTAYSEAQQMKVK